MAETATNNRVWRLLLARPEAVTTARHAVRALPVEDPVTVELLTSELVSNAVLHAACDPSESILVRARCNGAVRVEVCDEGGGEPAPQDAEPLAEHGRGLMLVDALASRWGTYGDQPRCVWFELESGEAA